MSDEKQKFMADIVADIRERAENAMRNGERLVHNEAVAMLLRSFADRLEAAWKRDEDHAVEHTTRHAEAVARDNCRDCVHNPRGKNYGGGNVAAMRDALVAVKKSIDGIGESSLDCDPIILMASLTQVCARLSARIEQALAAPQRNCDVGTAEEQAKRFNDFCSTHICNKCVVHDKMAHSFNDGILERAFSCRLVFSQMPYEAEEGVRK